MMEFYHNCFITPLQLSNHPLFIFKFYNAKSYSYIYHSAIKAAVQTRTNLLTHPQIPLLFSDIENISFLPFQQFMFLQVSEAMAVLESTLISPTNIKRLSSVCPVSLQPFHWTFPTLHHVHVTSPSSRCAQPPSTVPVLSQKPSLLRDTHPTIQHHLTESRCHHCREQRHLVHTRVKCLSSRCTLQSALCV